ncbi:DUF4179 domain-containing protein [Sporosarcina sp. Te-1]|uniref:DUF4179 domain-containing protein n=1 Tax=Sporosarcina sp. Te-1 TaxID=2818390 RepID=UPI001A9FB244|nr:DUF4179 domain-containing protein [Sporosarcina sp. Te-1]QTD40110.1 DUF4179 domain-containing protein [Sporosarcina sp. Te-1]
MKNLYRQFNELNLDIEVVPMDVSEAEKNRIKGKVLRKKKNYRTPKLISAAAALVLATTVASGFAFPTFAAKLPIIGNLFEMFTDNESYVFEEYDTHTTDIGVTRESNGISLTVENAVYDGESISIAYKMVSDKDLGEFPILQGVLDAPEFRDKYKHYGYAPKYISKRISENEYAGLFIYQLIKGPKPEEIHVTWKGDQVIDINNTSNAISGEWSYEFKLNKLEAQSKDYIGSGLLSKNEGINVTLTKMTSTPISTTLYLSERIDIPTVTMQDTEWRSILLDYKVTDDIGNEYNFIHYPDIGHISNFNHSKPVSMPRITMSHLDERATSLYITPIVNIYEIDKENGSDFIPIKEPFEVEPIIVPLEK